MGGEVFAQATRPMTLTAEVGGEAYYLYMRDKGLDLANTGDWQRRYAEMLDHAVILPGKRVLDIGCAMGALTLALHERGAEVWGIEINPHLVQHTPFKWLRGRLLVGDASTVLAMFRDGTFDLVHASQTLEHIPEAVQADLFVQIRRVLRVNGLFFAAMPMHEPPADGQPDAEDPTHVCIRPKAWWQQFQVWDFTEAPDDLHARLTSHPMYQEYRWDYLFWRRNYHEVRPVHRVSVRREP